MADKIITQLLNIVERLVAKEADTVFPSGAGGEQTQS